MRTARSAVATSEVAASADSLACRRTAESVVVGPTQPVTVMARTAKPAARRAERLIAAAGRTSVDLSDKVRPLYKDKLASGRLAEQLDLAARLVNADLGIRVLHVSFGSFDHHANLPGEHGQRMSELDAGIKVFFDKLAAKFAGRVTLLTFSEFGRRVQANQSNGTDHGTASALFAVGAGVKGGLYGQMPSLGALDRSGNLVATVDFRSVYATVLDGWLGADSKQLLGGAHENLGFLKQPG